MLTRAFGSPHYQEDTDAEREVFEPERSLAVIDDGRFVAGTAIYSLRMALPGRPAPVAGSPWSASCPTTAGGVCSPRSWRGNCKSCTRRHASRSQPYGRPNRESIADTATPRQRGIWDPNVPRLAGGGDPAGGALRLADDLSRVRADLAGVYDAVWPERVGHFARTTAWWDLALHDPEHERQGLTRLCCLLHYGTSGAADGYVLYSTADRWEPSGAAAGVVRVRELVAADPGVTGALWGFVLDIDLMARTEIGSVAVDDPLLHLLGDVRQAQPRLKDGLWVRLVDVGRALAAGVTRRRSTSSWT